MGLDAEDAVKVPDDPVQFCVDWLGYTPFRYMWPFLRDESHFLANVQARQTGKTFNGMAKILWYAFRYPKSLILVTAPKFDQAKNIAFKALAEHLNRMKARSPELFNAAVADATDLHTPFWVMDGLLVFSALMVAVFAKELIKTRFNKGGAALSQP